MAYPQQSSTVVVTQPVMQAVTVSVRPWSSGMCACFDDCGTCKQFIKISILYLPMTQNHNTIAYYTNYTSKKACVHRRKTRKYINVLSGY